jgi:hypothetical protein
MGTGGPFGGKARPKYDADHSPPSTAEVKNELELYFLSPWRLHGGGRIAIFFLLEVLTSVEPG